MTPSTLIVGCGYLGRRVGRLLANDGERVWGTTRSAANADRLRAWGVGPVIADVLDEHSLRALPRADRVFVAVGFDRAAGASVREVHVEGLKRLLATLTPTRWVLASSTGVYGQDDGSWVDEDAPTDPLTESGRACLDAERLLLGSGLSAVVLRFAGLYGPGRVIRRQALERGEPVPGDPDRFLNLIHIDDAARATVAALRGNALADRYNVGDDHPTPRREYYGLVAEYLGVGPPRFTGAPARDDAHKRICNRRMRADLLPELIHPDIATGVPAALSADDLP